MHALELDRPPVELKTAFGRTVHAGENLDQRRLAGAVLAEQDVDLTRKQIEIDVIERKHAGELHGQASRPVKPAWARLPRPRCLLAPMSLPPTPFMRLRSIQRQLTEKTGFQSAGASDDA